MFGIRVALLTTAMSGCESTDPAALTAIDEAEFNSRYSAIHCRRLAMCGLLGPWGYDSEGECVADNIAYWELGPQLLADACPEATYSPTQAAACLDFAKNSTNSCELGTALCDRMEWYQDSCYAPIDCYESEEGCM